MESDFLAHMRASWWVSLSVIDWASLSVAVLGHQQHTLEWPEEIIMGIGLGMKMVEELDYPSHMLE